MSTVEADAVLLYGETLPPLVSEADAALLYGTSIEASPLAGRNLRDAYLNLPEGDRPADPKGSYARRIAEGLELDTSNRGSGSWEKVIAQTDEEPSTPGSWKTRALRFIRKGLE